MKRRISSWFTVPVKLLTVPIGIASMVVILRGLLSPHSLVVSGAGVVGRYAGSAGSCWRLLLPAKIRQRGQ